MKKLFLILVSSLFLVGGCVEQKTEVVSNEWEITLTKEEASVYDSLKRDSKKEDLKSLNPMGVAKLYIQATIDKQYDVQYDLYTTREGHVQWTKEEHMKIPTSDRMSPKQARKTFAGIDEATFTENGFEGTLVYKQGEGEENKKGFQMMKDEDGTWKVSFMPIQ